MARIIDLADQMAVYATRLLAEAGHEIIRIDAPGGDSVRRMPPFLGGVRDIEHGAYHCFFNAGKRSLSADLDTEPGRDLLLDLARTADGVVVSESRWADAGALVAANPRLVVAQVQDEVSSELLNCARSGLLSLVGHSGGTPVVLGGHVANCAVGLYVVVATAAALYRQQETGRGELIRLSVADCLEAMMEQAAITYSTEGRVTQRRGYRGEITAASSAFEAADGFWLLSVNAAGRAWQSFMDWMQDPVLMADPSLVDEAQRYAKRDLIAERLDAWSRQHPRSELVAEGQRRHIPVAPLSTVLEILEDEQLLARGYFEEKDDPQFGRVRMPRGAIATARGVHIGRAPTLGQDNAEILAKLGYSAEDHEALIAVGAL